MFVDGSKLRLVFFDELWRHVASIMYDNAKRPETRVGMYTGSNCE
jgi:hypothetical protein